MATKIEEFFDNGDIESSTDVFSPEERELLSTVVQDNLMFLDRKVRMARKDFQRYPTEDKFLKIYLTSKKELTQYVTRYKAEVPKKKAARDTSALIDNLPKFKVEDIVYLKSDKNPNYSHLPYIGSGEEIDCKVLEVLPEENHHTITNNDKYMYLYSMMSGHGKRLKEIPEVYLVTPADKHLYGNSKFKELQEDTELAPKGTIFILENNYYKNDKLGIYISVERLEKDLKYLFK